MELKDFKDVVRVMTKEEFESAINEDIKFVERFKHFFKHDDVARIIEHVKSVLEASVDYFYPNHPEVEFEKDFNIQYDVNNILNKYGHTEMGMYKIQLYIENILGSIQNKLCSECAAIEYSKGDEVVVVPGTWHGKFKKEWPTEEEKKHIGKNGILNM